MILLPVMLTITAVYGLIGLFFAIAFVFNGIRHVDPAANGSNLAFRLIILPGVVALWPILLSRWIVKRAA